MTPRRLVGTACCAAFVLALTTPHWFALAAAIFLANGAILTAYAWEDA